jgi:GTP-binding protein
MFHDKARIFVEGGRGGDGVVSFRREAHVPRGGPDGGDGGHGGDVVLVCDPSRRDLASMRVSAHYRAERGAHGQGANKAGARGKDRIVLVPPGTTVAGLEGEFFDLVEAGQRATVAAGGLGGHGNKKFAAATRQTPRFAENGLTGASGWVELQLRLLADAGLVGLPNAGKSSLLARLTRAAPKVANYPFTTLEPILGTIDDGERQLVLADIPGLIEGAAEGAGLGHEFLAHVERCRVLLHLVELGEGSDPELAYRTVRGELEAHGAGLGSLPEVIVLSKADLMPADELELHVDEWSERHPDLKVLAISSATGAGLPELTNELFSAVAAADSVETEGAPRMPVDPAFETEHRIYRPRASGGFDIAVIDDGVFAVEGRGVEMLVERHDLSNPEAISYLGRRFTEIGVIKALRDAGFESGDEVRVGDEAFDLEA